jgi:hypothetical protein
MITAYVRPSIKEQIEAHAAANSMSQSEAIVVLITAGLAAGASAGSMYECLSGGGCDGRPLCERAGRCFRAVHPAA